MRGGWGILLRRRLTCSSWRPTPIIPYLIIPYAYSARAIVGIPVIRAIYRKAIIIVVGIIFT